MPGIDQNAEFYPLNIAVLTISDTRDLDTDTSGAVLADRLTKSGHNLADRAIVKDDIAQIRAQVTAWADRDDIDIILSTGGTGFSPRDCTLEAVKPLLRREMDGFSVVFHQKSMQTVGVATMQSRAFAGQIGERFIFCLPGSTGACKDAWHGLLELEFDSRHKPCSIAGAIPRLSGLGL